MSQNDSIPMEVEGDDGKDEVQQHSFDLTSYIAPSSGHGRIEKLIFIAKAAKGTPIELQALQMAHDFSKKVSDDSAMRSSNSPDHAADQKSNRRRTF
jgi:hypothetical protein